MFKFFGDQSCLMVAKWFDQETNVCEEKIIFRVSEQLPPRKIAPRLGLGLGWGAIFLAGSCPRTNFQNSKSITVISDFKMFPIMFFETAEFWCIAALTARKNLLFFNL